MSIKRITLLLTSTLILMVSPLIAISRAQSGKHDVTANLDYFTYLPQILKQKLSLIAFSSSRDGLSNIFLMSADGTNPTNLTNNSAGNWGDYAPSWSPDGSKIAFMSDRDWGGLPGGNGFEIFTMNADGTNVTRLTFNQKVDQSPAWSPDGSKIAFVSDRGSTTGVFDVFVMNIDGTNQIMLTQQSGIGPAWSSDGNQIAFSSNRDGNYEIYTMNADGSNQARLTYNPASDFAPAWSPDMDLIAFASDRDDNIDIYTMDVDGSNQTRITYNPASDSLPAWSPDSIRMAFVSYRDGNSEIYVMDANGSSQTRLTMDPSSDSLPEWSPGN